MTDEEAEETLSMPVNGQQAWLIHEALEHQLQIARDAEDYDRAVRLMLLSDSFRDAWKRIHKLT